jgi:hypothetical protein
LCVSLSNGHKIHLILIRRMDLDTFLLFLLRIIAGAMSRCVITHSLPARPSVLLRSIYSLRLSRCTKQYPNCKIVETVRYDVVYVCTIIKNALDIQPSETCWTFNFLLFFTYPPSFFQCLRASHVQIAPHHTHRYGADSEI